MKTSLLLIAISILTAHCTFLGFQNDPQEDNFPAELPYVKCLDGRYGLSCSNVCKPCPTGHHCDDGPVGSGKCYPIEQIPIMTSTLLPLYSPSISPRRKGLSCSASGESKIFTFSLDGTQPHSDIINTILGTDEALPTTVHNYSGHQFQDPNLTLLGDGRTHNFVINSTSYNTKGTGITKFSRPGTDGRSSFSHSCREFILSSYLNEIGIDIVDVKYLHLLPCTSDSLIRDYLYEGERSVILKGGVLTRVNEGGLYRLGSVTSKKMFESVCKMVHEKCECERECFYRATVKAVGGTSAKWQVYGFVHGSLNTDNVLLNGVTVDVSVASFLKTFKLDWSVNLLDEEGVYSYGRAGEAMVWNLERLRETLGLGLELDLDAETLFNSAFRGEFETMLERRLGVVRGEELDERFIAPRPHITYGFLKWLQLSGANMNLAFHHLGGLVGGELGLEEYVRLVGGVGFGSMLGMWLTYFDGEGGKEILRVWNDSEVSKICNIFDDNASGNLPSLVRGFNESFSAMLESFKEGGGGDWGGRDLGGEEWQESCSIQ